MKNEIRDAYERMNPPKEAKERMMKNIMKKQNKGSTYYTAAPSPERWWTAIPAALALVAVLVIGWQFLIPVVEGPMTDDPVASANPSKDPVNMELDILQLEELFPDVPADYRDILANYYVALHENASEEDWTRMGLNPAAYENLDVIEGLGYALMDLDENGTQELLITDGDQVYDLYVQVDGEIRELLSGRIDAQGKRNSIKLCQDNTLMIWQKSSGVDFLHWRRLGKDGLGDIALVCEETVSSGDDGKWYAGPNDKDAVQVSEEKAREIMNSRDPVFVNYTSIYPKRFAGNLEGILPAGYGPVIGKYIKAHEEGWSVEEYMQNDICYVLGMQDSIWEYGYALMDLNEDGIDELLITDGKLIYDLYILMEDGGAGHVISAGERARYYLCEDNVIGYRGSGSAANTVMEFFRVLPSGDFQYELKLEFEEGTWYTYKDYGKETPGGVDVVSEEQAQDLINGYAPVEIVYQSFLRPEAEKTNDTSESLPAGYAQVLDKYIRAYNENWTFGQYTENGLSYLLYGKDIFADYGYALIDLNSDGKEELLITDGGYIYDMYKLMADGSVFQICSMLDKTHYYLCEDYVIGVWGASGENSFSYEFTKMEPTGESTIKMYLQYDAGTWQKIEGGSDKMVAISEDEAWEILADYSNVNIPFQALLRLEQGVELKYPRTYAQMLREKIAEHPGVMNMVAAFADVTGDGEEELLLGSRGANSFGQVYGIVDGRVEQILTYGMDVNFLLCKNGVICHHNPEKPFDNYVFISIKDNEHVIIESLAYSEDEKSWGRTTSGTRENISDAEMQEILDFYGSVSLNWISVLEVIG